MGGAQLGMLIDQCLYIFAAHIADVIKADSLPAASLTRRVVNEAFHLKCRTS
jgi:hypothetical protein